MRNWFYVFIGILFLATPFITSAHPGNTDSYGCHTCKTNCSNWGLSYGEYHCHNAKGLYQPEEPIRSHYGDYGTGYTEPWPNYTSPSYNTYTYPTTPSCPTFSRYDSFSGDCECIYGYVAYGGQCVSQDTYCQNKHGYNSEYNILTDSCQCRSGYVADSSGLSCVSGDSYCYQKYGFGSQYDSLSKFCECRSGYTFNSSGQCVSENTYCTDLFGSNAEHNILTDSCSCKSGYVVNSSRTSCVSGTSYCQNLYGYNATFDSYSKTCECGFGYELIGGSCQKEVKINPTPVIISPVQKTKPQEITTPTPKTLPAISQPILPTPQPKIVKNEPSEIKENEFKLEGNERLRGCPSLDCSILKSGSFNGKAKILDKNGEWYKVLVTDSNSSQEGWFSAILIPQTLKDNFLPVSEIKAQPSNEEAKSWRNFFGRIFNFF